MLTGIGATEPRLDVLQRQAGGPEDGVKAGQREQRTGPGAALVCARCAHAVTTTAERIEVDGSHEHSFVNPGGIRFRIGCFAQAQCRGEGGFSEEFTWFPGHSWRIQVCPGCRELLGWFYKAEGSRFYGLILVQLREQSQGG